MTTAATVSLVDRVKELISSGDFQLPPVPALALRLRTALEDDSIDRRELVELIHAEPAVTATLLRTANSPALGFRSTSDLSQAISRLGLRHVSAIVTAVLVQGQFETKVTSNQKTLKTLWNHATPVRPSPKTWRSGGTIRQRTRSWRVCCMGSVGCLSCARSTSWFR